MVEFSLLELMLFGQVSGLFDDEFMQLPPRDFGHRFEVGSTNEVVMKLSIFGIPKKVARERLIFFGQRFEKLYGNADRGMITDFAVVQFCRVI